MPATEDGSALASTEWQVKRAVDDVDGAEWTRESRRESTIRIEWEDGDALHTVARTMPSTFTTVDRGPGYMVIQHRSLAE